MTVTQMKMFGESSTSHSSNTMEIDAIDASARGDKKKQCCDKCGNWHTKQQTCPAQGVECHKCGKRNHFARVCQSKVKRSGTSSLHSIEQEKSSDEGEHLFVASLHTSSKSKEWKVTIKFNNQKMVF